MIERDQEEIRLAIVVIPLIFWSSILDPKLSAHAIIHYCRNEVTEVLLQFFALHACSPVQLSLHHHFNHPAITYDMGLALSRCRQSSHQA